MIELLDFWSPSCGPCMRQMPILEELAQQCPEVQVRKLNAFDDVTEAMEYNVSALPTLVFLKDGQEVKRFVGLQKLETLVGVVNEFKE